jgi:hypothetical protein
MSGTPRILHRYWSDGALSSEGADNLVAWRATHPGWELQEWSRSTLPAEALDLIELAEPRVLPRDRVRHESNVVRYWALHEYGGVWADVDVRPLHSIEPVLGTFAFVSNAFGAAEGAFMGGPAGHGFFAELLWTMRQERFAGRSVDVSGASLLRRVLRDRGDVVMLREHLIFNGDPHLALPGTLVSHTWSSSRLAASTGVAPPESADPAAHAPVRLARLDRATFDTLLEADHRSGGQVLPPSLQPGHEGLFPTQAWQGVAAQAVAVAAVSGEALGFLRAELVDDAEARLSLHIALLPAGRRTPLLAKAIVLFVDELFRRFPVNQIEWLVPGHLLSDLGAPPPELIARREVNDTTFALGREWPCERWSLERTAWTTAGQHLVKWATRSEPADGSTSPPPVDLLGSEEFFSQLGVQFGPMFSESDRAIPLLELPLDSLQLVELAVFIEELSGATLAPALRWDSVSVGNLYDHYVASVGAAHADRTSADAPPRFVWAPQ